MIERDVECEVLAMGLWEISVGVEETSEMGETGVG